MQRVRSSVRILLPLPLMSVPIGSLLCGRVFVDFCGDGPSAGVEVAVTVEETNKVVEEAMEAFRVDCSYAVAMAFKARLILRERRRRANGL